MTTKSKLKRCPFCGGKASMYNGPAIGYNWQVECGTCGAIGCRLSLEKNAARHWNIRVGDKK